MVLLQGLVFGRILLESLNRRAAAPAARLLGSGSTTGRQQFSTASGSSSNAPPVPSSSACSSTTRFATRKKPERRRTHLMMPYNPFTAQECLQRIGGTSIRSIRSLSTNPKQNLQELLKDETWVAVYRFPGIRFGVLLARAKLLQTITSILLIPYTYWQYLNDQASAQFLTGVSVLAILATSMLMLFSRYFNRMIGVIAMSESNQFVRVGYLSFWGGRRNKILELDDALPLSEANENLNDAIVKFRQYSSASYLYLPISKVELLDEERAELLFGDLSVFNRSKKND
ncbi:unnamed protein product [Anisakis simplex]|uniref:Transmembrane protein 186 n=1 Tax=Anisakis simplex TaxID=6269 RepID=A0A0M3K4G0_ANISI|nr:unnamed protein product [Anisakis simplex]